ncbi:PKD domain-containing protein, partial [bacterium]|nr:PKD domain-containing protein [bacterium]
MRKHWISFILCIMATGLAAQWSAPKIISDGYAPDFDIDPANGHLHVVSVLNGVIYTETDAEGNIVSGPQVIPGTTQDTEYWNFGATVAVDKNGYPHVCYRVYQGSNYLYNVYYTRKTGSGWLSNPLPLSSNRRRGYVVRMDIDSQNRVHVGIGWDDNDTDGQTIGPIAYYRIRNAIIEKAVDDINPAQIYYRVDNRFEMTVGSDDRVHFVAGCPGFPLTLEGPVTYFYSADNGNSFETVGNIHSPYCPTRNGNADIAVDNKGYVHMLYGAKIDNERNDQPSLRYVRYKNGKLIDKPITQPGDVKPWDWNPAVGPEHGKNYGLGSIACSEDGALVLAAFIDRPTFYSGSTLYMGNLYVMMSTDSGATWGAKQMLAEYVCNAEGGIQGRNLELIRSYKNHFYIIYPHSQNPKKVKMVYLRNVGDNPPVAHAGGPYSASEGGTITLNASGCTDSGQNPGIVKYEWDLNNDGIYDLTATQPTLQTSAVNDLYTSIKLRITDNAGHTSEATSSIQVLNVAPTVEAGKDTTINEGSTLGFHCTYTDPGVQDTHTIQWNFRDGTTSPDQSPFHTFNNDGQVTVTVKVTDNNNGIGRDSLKVTINNVPPVANAG